MQSQIEITQVKIEELNPSPYNPRKASDKEVEDLKKSITSFGLVDPIIVNSNPGRRNIIVGGHFRLRVAKELGFSEVPVVYVDLDIEREKELNLRLNKNSGSWDLKLLEEFDRGNYKVIRNGEEIEWKH